MGQVLAIAYYQPNIGSFNPHNIYTFTHTHTHKVPYFTDEKAEKQGKDIIVPKVMQQGNNGARV